MDALVVLALQDDEPASSSLWLWASFAGGSGCSRQAAPATELQAAAVLTSMVVFTDGERVGSEELASARMK